MWVVSVDIYHTTTEKIVQHLFNDLFKIILVNQLHVYINFMLSLKIFFSKNLMRKGALFYIFVNHFNV